MFASLFWSTLVYLANRFSLDSFENSVTLIMAINRLSTQEIKLKRIMKQRQKEIKQNIKYCILICNKNDEIIIQCLTCI
jgi:hypothetical protein